MKHTKRNAKKLKNTKKRGNLDHRYKNTKRKGKKGFKHTIKKGGFLGVFSNKNKVAPDFRAADEESDIMKEIIQKLTYELDVLNNNNEVNVKELAELKETIDKQLDLRNEIKERIKKRIVENKITENKTELTKEVESLTKKNEELTEQIELLTKENEELTKKNKSLTEQIESLTKEVESLTKEKKSLTEQIVELTKEVESLTKEKKSLTEEIESLTKENEELFLLSQEISDLKNKLKIKELETGIKDKQLEIFYELKIEIESKKKELNETNEKLQQSELKTKLMTEKIEGFKIEIESKKKELNETNDKLQQSELETIIMTEKIADFKIELKGIIAESEANPLEKRNSIEKKIYNGYSTKQISNIAKRWNLKKIFAKRFKKF